MQIRHENLLNVASSLCTKSSPKLVWILKKAKGKSWIYMFCSGLTVLVFPPMEAHLRRGRAHQTAGTRGPGDHRERAA